MATVTSPIDRPLQAPDAARAPLRAGRRRFLAASAGCAVLPAVAAVDGFLVTPGRLETTFHVVGGAAGEPAAGGAMRTRGGAVRTGGPIRILQISDLHIRGFGDFEERVLEAVAALRPDIVVHTGDMLESRRGFAPLREFLDRCPGVPTFAIPGNWEYASGLPMTTFDGLCRTLGIDWLVNRSVVVERGDTSLVITGLDDLRSGRPDCHAAASSSGDAPNRLVLAHCPAQRDRLGQSALARADLVLSGHTHGGQVAPLGMPLVLPTGSGRYVSGWYGRGDASGPPPLYVARGVGTSVIPVRLGSRPELAVFDWHLA
jgi:predicted MPP superfamily phosphohydrolase